METYWDSFSRKYPDKKGSLEAFWDYLVKECGFVVPERARDLREEIAAAEKERDEAAARYVRLCAEMAEDYREKTVTIRERRDAAEECEETLRTFFELGDEPAYRGYALAEYTRQSYVHDVSAAKKERDAALEEANGALNWAEEVERQKTKVEERERALVGALVEVHEACGDATSKLESQTLRNPDLPLSYGIIVKRAFDALRECERYMTEKGVSHEYPVMKNARAALSSPSPAPSSEEEKKEYVIQSLMPLLDDGEPAPREEPPRKCPHCGGPVSEIVLGCSRCILTHPAAPPAEEPFALPPDVDHLFPEHQEPAEEPDDMDAWVDGCKTERATWLEENPYGETGNEEKEENVKHTYHAWLVEYPDEGSIEVQAENELEAIDIAGLELGEGAEEIAVCRITAEEHGEEKDDAD